MGLNIAESVRWQARQRPDAIALIEGARRVSYGELDRMAAGCANALRVLGVQPRERVMIVLPNSIAWAVMYHGVLQSGAIPVPINPLLVTPEIAAIARDCDPALIFDDGRHACELREALPEFNARGTIIDVGVEAAGLTIMPGTLAHPFPEFEPGETAVILYSSGSTGRPKGVELSHFNILWNVQAFAHDLLKLTPQDRGYGALPFAHVFGHTCMFSTFLHVGASIVLAAKFDAASAMRAMAGERVSVFMGVPTMYWNLRDTPIPDGVDLSALRACVSGGQALSEQVHQRFEEKFGVLISEGYGMTEASPSIVGNRFTPEGRRMGAAGKPYWGVEIRIHGSQGQELPAGQDGEVIVRTPGMARGYFNQPEMTAQTFRDGWLHTGDIGHLDADGFLYIVDRKKELIITGGYNIYPREIEEVLFALEGVAKAAVISVPDARLGERIVAFVETIRPLGEHEVLTHCQKHLARYKVPREVCFVQEFALDASGKVDRQRLRKEYREREPSAA
ncbi:class I adenylate-forming enzyme family protein [Verminephrobacter eiseniae]|uniref:class I adenylate-forming enzyme family protein n=1 Tax=Verminephrobacter eiseniae TaxID=364317 RepID=UPI002237B508|nr:AMP-binding protein [Verminephrobacter eiseniae]MCW5231019.1 AMP-binding protein [Verminephrobacter eiseniae]MCW5292752.1 AMP-binding protein [Verminephrobacter eiseniae]MCW8184645.1 AMP-binding protein [Verminephrobacter eiseniae]MCW8223321.1 AMP-binding protein [Verminephrobacter eiseniae]MCW8234552.1 AMP-binding protein [Verminephrobacter eiseniae]